MKRQYEICFNKVYIYAENQRDAENRANGIMKNNMVTIKYVVEDETYRKHNNIKVQND